MQLDRLEIAGFFHFADPATLDLRDIPPGLVAIVGANGEGKTRFLDAGPASLYGPGSVGAFPSRDGTLAQYATSRDAYIDTLWSVEGEAAYHSVVSVDGVQRVSKAVLEEILSDGRRIMLNDGLVTTYKAVVKERFPSRRQVLASAYAAQRQQGSFAGLDQRNKFELFSEMLGLDHLEAMGATAKEIANVADRVRGRLRAVIDTLNEAIEREDPAGLERRLEELASLLAQTSELRQRAVAEVERLEVERKQWVESAAEHLVSVKQVTTLRESIVAHQNAKNGLQNELDRLPQASEAALAQQVQAQQRVRRQLDTDRETARARLQETLADLVGRIQECESVVSRADEIRDAVKQRAAWEEELQQARHREAEQRVALSEATVALNAVGTQLLELKDVQRQLDENRERAQMISEVPFGDKCAEASCRFLVKAVESRGRMPALQQTLATRGDLENDQTARAEVVRQLQLALVETVNGVKELERQLRLEKVSTFAAELLVAESRIASFREQIAQAERDFDERMRYIDTLVEQSEADFEKQAADITQRRVESQQALSDKLTSAVVEITRLEHQLIAEEELAQRTRVAQNILDQVEVGLVAARRAVEEISAETVLLSTQRDDVARRLESVTRRIAERDDSAARLVLVDNEWLAWRTLMQALSRDGLPKLEIDAAGPTISNLTNSLLEAGFGTRFTVEIATQVARADGKGLKEDFTVTVFDNEFGVLLNDLTDLSGGERVVIEEALRAGILLFNNSRQQRPIRTCWRDETTGALNPENVPRYVKMLRRMHHLGGFRHTLFVTHSESAAAMADTVVRFQNGQPAVERAA